MENCGVCISWSFGIFSVSLIYLLPLGTYMYSFPLWYVLPRKIWQPCCSTLLSACICTNVHRLVLDIVPGSTFNIPNAILSAKSRLTRLVEFLRIGRRFTLGYFFSISEEALIFGRYRLPFVGRY
jgi:hypothetical protein